MLRVAQGGCYTYLPYRSNGRFPSLPPAASFCFIDSQRAHVAYVTDREGARVRSRAEARVPCPHCVVAVGDSQALGYGIPYDATFTASYAARTGRPSVIVAAPADDPGTERLALAHYLAATGTVPDLLFAVVNFGNDVDEMFLWHRTAGTAGASSWLPEHSFLFANLALAGRILARKFAPAPLQPAGANPVAFALAPAQRARAETELTATVAGLVRESRSRSAVVVVIPADDVLAPSEFEKYRKYYSAAEYGRWRERLPRMAAVMNAVQDGFERRLRASGLRVLDARGILARLPATEAFDRYSQHLTARANELLARELLANRTR